MSKSSAAYQPIPQPVMDLAGSHGKEERASAGSCGCGEHHEQTEFDDGHASAGCRARHGGYHTERKRRLFRLLTFGALFSLFALAVAAFASGGIGNLLNCAGSTLAKRADGTSGDDFTNRKLYLIIVFVGLFLCLVFGIMLAAWCCKGSFENPLCCPCYLCACCGGLVCLECISCGLCAEGADLAFDG